MGSSQSTEAYRSHMFYRHYARPYHHHPRYGWYPPLWAPRIAPRRIIVAPPDIEIYFSEFSGRRGIVRSRSGEVIGTFILESVLGEISLTLNIGDTSRLIHDKYARNGAELIAYNKNFAIRYDPVASRQFNETVFRLNRENSPVVYLSWQE